MANIVLVDCEGGPYAGPGMLREFGMVLFDEPPFSLSFHGDVASDVGGDVAKRAAGWLDHVCSGRPTFWSDNPAYDWQHVNWLFHHHLGENPFGHSARRISDFYAGLKGNARNTQSWKRWRITKHDHNPVNDARGNAEALWEILRRHKEGTL